MKERIVVVLLSASLVVSCSELNKDLPAPASAGEVHTDGWSVVSSPDFHGKALKAANWNDAACQKCHGGNYQGGTSGVSCLGCHAAYPHAVAFSAGGHPAFMRARGFPLDQCKTCHGSTYSGGLIVTKSCQESGCHADASGNGKSPESCNTCHGNFRAAANLAGLAYLLSAAPPKSVVGDTAQTVAGVGAHQKHLATGTTGRTVKCQECHSVPAAVSDAGHLGALPAEVAFNDTLARLATAKGPIAPSYAAATVTCSNTYCHGNWGLRRATSSYQFAYADTMMEGAGTAPQWTAGTAQGQCYSCHGAAGASPTYVPKGHIPATPATCSNCHTGIVDGSGNIIDKTRHINGKVNVFGTERVF